LLLFYNFISVLILDFKLSSSNNIKLTSHSKFDSFKLTPEELVNSPYNDYNSFFYKGPHIEAVDAIEEFLDLNLYNKITNPTGRYVTNTFSYYLLYLSEF
jgi:hypothetical protein